jgi:hypothetical protein
LTSGERLLWICLLWICLLWICLSHLWRDWRSALAIVKPETVVAWHRAGFRLFWTWKVRGGQTGRPVILREVRDLIRKMCRENPGWGAPRIHGELLKLGIDIGESSVSKYMVCRRSGRAAQEVRQERRLRLLRGNRLSAWPPILMRPYHV